MSYDEYTSCEIKVLGTVSSTCLPGYSIARKCSCLLGLGEAHLNAARLLHWAFLNSDALPSQEKHMVSSVFLVFIKRKEKIEMSFNLLSCNY